MRSSARLGRPDRASAGPMGAVANSRSAAMQATLGAIHYFVQSARWREGHCVCRMDAVGAKYLIAQNGAETRTVNNLKPAAPGPGLHERIKSLHRYLLAGLVAALLAVAFVSIAGEVLEGDTAGFDGVVLRQAQSLRAGHPGFVSAIRDLSGLGSTVVLTVFVTLGVGYLILVAAPTTAILVAVSAGSATVLVSALKAVFSRLRPDGAFSEIMVPGLSFPSGHATMSAAIFLTMGALLASTRHRWAERIYILFAAAVLTVLVGMSRIALGVHWATDVLGGWAFGSAWAMIWLMVARWLSRRDAAT